MPHIGERGAERRIQPAPVVAYLLHEYGDKTSVLAARTARKCQLATTCATGAVSACGESRVNTFHTV